MNEPDFIALLRTLPLAPGARNLNDDAATLEIGGETLVLTHDAIAEGIHYRPGTDPFDIAWKLVATNLSDLAAKGAQPLGVLIGAALIENGDRFVEGLRAILTEYDVPLLGGDTIRLSENTPASFGCTAIGRATHRPVPSRTAARPGDMIWLAGVIGEAMRGFHGEPDALPAYLRPRPLLSEGIALAPHVHAMMDVSDGLLLDALRMAKASGCTFDIDTNAVPCRAQDRAAALRWGDDYALLFTAPEDAALPVPATRIGRVLAGGEHPLLIDGAPPQKGERLGYEHG